MDELTGKAADGFSMSLRRELERLRDVHLEDPERFNAISRVVAPDPAAATEWAESTLADPLAWRVN